MLSGAATGPAVSPPETNDGVGSISDIWTAAKNADPECHDQQCSEHRRDVSPAREPLLERMAGHRREIIIDPDSIWPCSVGLEPAPSLPFRHAAHGLDDQGHRGERAVLRLREPRLRGRPHARLPRRAPRSPGSRRSPRRSPTTRTSPASRPAGATWWPDGRPASLNVRQRINANWARSLLEPFGWAEWLFHIDGDEVARLDRDALAAVPPELGAVWLPPWEAVSQWTQPERPTRFKRLLDDPDLNLLHVLGAIGDADQPGVLPRPRDGEVRRPARPPGSRSPSTRRCPRTGSASRGTRTPGSRVLHYDAPSGEEFVRKWTALAQAGPARYRADRAPSARALRALASSDLPEDDPGQVPAPDLRPHHPRRRRAARRPAAPRRARPDASRPRRRGRSPRARPSSSPPGSPSSSALPKAGFYVDDAPRAAARGRGRFRRPGRG